MGPDYEKSEIEGQPKLADLQPLHTVAQSGALILVSCQFVTLLTAPRQSLGTRVTERCLS